MDRSEHCQQANRDGRVLGLESYVKYVKCAMKRLLTVNCNLHYFNPVNISLILEHQNFFL